jgi:ABC-type multidrug transport system fused ATPase/permease subunit
VKYSNELLLVYVFCRIYRPRIVKNFVSYFTTNHNNFTKSQAWFLGVSFVTVQFIGFIYIDNFYLRLETFGVKIRTALTSLIYRKALKLNLSQLEDTTTGKIITLITRDVNEFDIYVFFTTYLWCDSLRFLITCYVVYMEVGLLVLVLFVIFCIIISTQSKSLYLGQTIRNVFFSSYLSQNISLAKDKNFKENGSEISSYQRNVGRNNFNKMLPLGRQL